LGLTREPVLIRGIMVFHKTSLAVFSLFVLTCCTGIGFGQTRTDGSAVQRLEVMRQKVDTMQRSLNGAISGLKEENKDDKPKKGEKESVDTPQGRLRGLLKEVSGLQGEITKLRGKVDRSEK